MGSIRRPAALRARDSIALEGASASFPHATACSRCTLRAREHLRDLAGNSRGTVPAKPVTGCKSAAPMQKRACAETRRALERPLAGAAHRESVDPQCRLSDANRDTLSVLATGTDAVVELQIVPHHAHAREYIGAIADECGAFQWRSQFAVLYLVRLAGGEHELPGGDIDLAATEVDGVDPSLDGTDDFLRSMRARAHVRVGHTRKRHVREGLASAIPRRSRARQT